MNVPAHKRDGCAALYPTEVRAALSHDRCASRASWYASLSRDRDEPDRAVYRRYAREAAAEARVYFEQWQGARR